MAREVRLSMKVWDGATRLFHWAIVLLVLTSYLAAETGRMRLHFLSGYAILALLLFRLAWGFVGSETARFRHFLRGPAEVLGHLRHFRQRGPDNEIGHNAAGGWMVLLMLALLAVQVGTGLFANDDIDTYGPFARRVPKATSDWLSAVHDINFWVIVAAIALHVSAVIAYAVVRGQDLVRPMVTGRKRLPGRTRPPRMASQLLALVLLLAAAGLVWALTSLA